MGEKEKYLKKTLYTMYEKGYHKPLSMNDLYNIHSDEIISVYKKLGGVYEPLKFRLGNYDIPCKDFIIEFDEELHFNRYRKLTLKSDVYKKLLTFPLDTYISYCENYETDCLKAGKYGGKWKNDNTEKQFEISSAFGDLSGTGPSRWKQRAFYDFLKDISQLIIGVKIIRISTWDTIDLNGILYRIGDLLDNHKDAELCKFINQRLGYCLS